MLNNVSCVTASSVCLRLRVGITCGHDLQRLKVAYVNKERAAQYEENLLLRQMENDKEQAISDKVQYGAVPFQAFPIVVGNTTRTPKNILIAKHYVPVFVAICASRRPPPSCVRLEICSEFYLVGWPSFGHAPSTIVPRLAQHTPVLSSVLMS